VRPRTGARPSALQARLRLEQERSVDDDTVVQVRGDAQHPLSRGYVCPKGRALGAFHHDPRRLDAPMRREGDGWQRQEWPDAIGEVSAALGAIIAESGPDAVAMYLASGSERQKLAFVRAQALSKDTFG